MQPAADRPRMFSIADTPDEISKLVRRQNVPARFPVAALRVHDWRLDAVLSSSGVQFGNVIPQNFEWRSAVRTSIAIDNVAS
jgi:hypothetical protein